MADFETIKTEIQANIDTNGNQEITGAVLQETLLGMVDATEENITELESNETNIIYSIFRKYIVFGILQSNGSINKNYSGWFSYNKVPMMKGDYLSLNLGFKPEISEFVNFIVFDTDNNIIYTENIESIKYTFENDGYFSFSFHESYVNHVNIRNSIIFPEIDRNFQEIGLEIQNIKKLSYDVLDIKDISEYITIGYLYEDGTVQQQGDWRTYSKIPVIAGTLFSASLGLIPALSGATAAVIFDSQENVIKTINTKNIEYIFEQSGYLSFCYYVPQTNTYSVREPIPFSEYLNNLNPTKSIKWCAIGDSITAGDENNMGTSYATYAADMMGKQIELQKLGYWGQTMKETLYPTAFNSIDDDTDLVTINFGSNDIFVLGEGQWGDIDEIIAKESDELGVNNSTFESLRLFLEKMREQHPSVLIYFINPIKRSYSGGVQERFNEKEKKICDYYSIPVLDAFNESGIRYDDVIYKADGIHPNDAGKLVFGRWLVSKLAFLNL